MIGMDPVASNQRNRPTVDGCEIHKPHHLEAMVETITFVGIYR